MVLPTSVAESHHLPKEDLFVKLVLVPFRCNPLFENMGMNGSRRQIFPLLPSLALVQHGF